MTVEHLLAHRSGIGDYLDEDLHDDVGAYVSVGPGAHPADRGGLPRCARRGIPRSLAPGERFSYNNGGYVLLALLAERAAGVRYDELVRTLVCEPAGMADTGFLRSDELPGDAALGYLTVDGARTNVLHAPVLGVGDGGAYSTAADFSSFWEVFYGGDRGAGPGRRDGASAQRLARGVRALRPRLPPGTRPATRSGWRGTTRESRFSASTSRRRT